MCTFKNISIYLGFLVIFSCSSNPKSQPTLPEHCVVYYNEITKKYAVKDTIWSSLYFNENRSDFMIYGHHPFYNTYYERILVWGITPIIEFNDSLSAVKTVYEEYTMREKEMEEYQKRQKETKKIEKAWKKLPF